ncbi:MAG TPA: SpoIIE family protein phosphatase [Ignavibacteriales bacterium]|nr:SpoIIE family protein phosphatase [Ignavibacteriales bacterium]
MRQDDLNDIRGKLLDRKNRLVALTQKYVSASEMVNLLEDVEAALMRINEGTFGTCEICGGPIETEALESDPTIRFCLDDMNPEQQRSLEEDLKLAMKIQRKLLPQMDLKVPGWDISYHYEPAGFVSGDYCDIITPDENSDHHYLIMGDVSGKGVAASMLMTHLHAMFHSLIGLNLKSNEIMERVNRQLCESTASSQFATLILADAFDDGKVELTNAGHCPPILFSSENSMELAPNGIPMGVMCGSVYGSSFVEMKQGDVLFIYTDGLSEASINDEAFETDRIFRLGKNFKSMTSRQVVESVKTELNSFLSGTPKTDDLTIMVLKRL